MPTDFEQLIAEVRAANATNTTETRPSCGVLTCTRCDREPVIRDDDGYDQDGYNRAGYDREGYRQNGYNDDGYDREGYDAYGYNREGRNRQGYDQQGWDRDGYNGRGFNAGHIHRNGTRYDDDGYDWRGFNSEGFDSEGYDRQGYDCDGYNRSGYDPNGYDSDGYDRNGYNEDGYDRYGDYQDSDDGDRSRLNYYSYTPRLQFRGERPPFYGLEIEVTTDRIGRLVDTVEEHAGNLIYCKDDSSVEGAELVTHPMTYEWAMENFPWAMLPALRTEADATIIDSDNGIHIHVSRDGFDNPAHMFRWMKFWYRNPRDIQRIARRRDNHWGRFRPEARVGQIEHVKRGKDGYDSRADSTLESRYNAINTTNDATLEVRVFASTLRPQRAQAALQLVAGSVEYARQLTAEDVCHRRGWDWRAFMAWTAKSGQYPALLTENRIRRPV